MACTERSFGALTVKSYRLRAVPVFSISVLPLRRYFPIAIGTLTLAKELTR